MIHKAREGKLKRLLARTIWMYCYVRRYWLQIGSLTLLGAAGSVLGLGTSVVSKYLIDAVTGVNSGSIGQTAAVYGGIGISQILINLVKGRVSLKIRLNVSGKIRADIYKKILEGDWEYLEHYSTGDFICRINGDTGVVTSGILSLLPNLIHTVISFLGAFFIIMREDRMMAALAMLGAPISFLSSRCLSGQMKEQQKNEAELSSSRMNLDQEIFQNLQLIKAFHIVDSALGRVEELQQKAICHSLRQNRIHSLHLAVTSFTGQLVGYACYGFCVYRLWRGEISYGTMTMCVSMAASLRSAFSSLIQFAPSMIRTSVSAGRVMELVSLPRENRDQAEEAGRMLKKGREAGIRIRMEQVDFRYRTGKKQVLQNVSLMAEPGEIIALVGPSGQGKTTVLRLLLGLFHPQKGRIFVRTMDGEELLVSSSTRCLFGYIPQENILFSGTIAENMRMVKPEASEEEIEEALKAACAWEFVKELENGIHTEVQERGRRFSEGQRQRLSIARALLTDAPVMLLDEATSALDGETERRVLRGIIKKEAWRTIIVAAHRPGVFSLCSRIYRVENGRLTLVEEQGIRESLNPS